MKTTFTLQEILSIKKQTWLEWIKEHLTEDEQKKLYTENEKWKKIATNDNGELLVDQYYINTASGSMAINFYNDHLFLSNVPSNDNMIQFNAKYMTLKDVMPNITQLIIIIFDLNAGNPLHVAEKVISSLKELIAI